MTAEEGEGSGGRSLDPGAESDGVARPLGSGSGIACLPGLAVRRVGSGLEADLSPTPDVGAPTATALDRQAVGSSRFPGAVGADVS